MHEHVLALQLPPIRGQSLPRGQRHQRQRRGFLKAQPSRLARHNRGIHRHIFGIGAHQPKQREHLVAHRPAAHALANRRHRPSNVSTQHQRHRKIHHRPRRPAADLPIRRVHAARRHFHQQLPRPRHGHLGVFINKLLGAAVLVDANAFHEFSPSFIFYGFSHVSRSIPALCLAAASIWRIPASTVAGSRDASVIGPCVQPPATE